MTAINTAIENIYASLHNDNEGIDEHIAELKAAMKAEGATTVDINPARLVQPNRHGRKLMQSYFKQRGVIINFLPTSA